MIFKNSRLCAQFLRDNFDIPVLKDIKPEDISDVTEKYRAYLGIHFEADTVKKIRLPGEETPELFLVSLIEHKSKVDYNIAMQLLRYMVCIWTEYAKEMEARQAGISRTKAFRYPPILPIVYYEGIENWTADRNLKDRIALKNIFGEYFPDFTYKVIPSVYKGTHGRRRTNLSICFVTFTLRTSLYASFRCLADAQIRLFPTLRPRP